MTDHISSETTTPETVFDQPRSERQGKQSKSVSQNTLIGSVIGVLILGAVGGFVAGMQVGKTSASSLAAGPGGQSQTTGGPGGMGGRRMGAMGTVTAVDASSISIKDQMQGTTSTYAITDSTTVTDNGESATVSDIAVGDQVMIRTASESSDDSSSTTTQTATSIMLNPSFGNGPMGQGQSSTNNTDTSAGSST